jgi:hypothetical protein
MFGAVTRWLVRATSARTATDWAPPLIWVLVTVLTLTLLHRLHWGFDPWDHSAWRTAWSAFASGVLIIDTLDKVLEWTSFPVGLAVAYAGASRAGRVWRIASRKLSRPVRDDTPLDSDYDPLVVTTPLPGRRASPARIDLKKLFDISDEAIQAQREALEKTLVEQAKDAVMQGYGSGQVGPARADDTEKVPVKDHDQGRNDPGHVGFQDGGATDKPGIPQGAVAIGPTEAVELRLYATIAKLGWSEAVIRTVPITSAASSRDTIDLILAGEARIYSIVIVVLPSGSAAVPFDNRGIWQIQIGGSIVEARSPIVRSVAIAAAVDDALQRANFPDDGPIVAPTVILCDGVLRADRAHESLWEEHELIVLSEPPGMIAATPRRRSLATVLGADRPSRSILDQVRSALDA